MTPRLTTVAVAALAWLVASSCASSRPHRKASQVERPSTAELPSDLVIEIGCFPHQYAPGYYRFGLTNDGTAVLVSLLGQKYTWHVTAEATEKAVSVLINGGLAEVDAVGEKGGSIVMALVRLDARGVRTRNAESQKHGPDPESLTELLRKVEPILGIDKVRENVAAEFERPAPRSPDSR